MISSNNIPTPVIYIASALLFIAIFPMPYGYYTLLRITATGVFVWVAIAAINQNEKIIPWIFIVLAILFNPIIKIHFAKEIWAVIDFGAAAFLLWAGKKISS